MPGRDRTGPQGEGPLTGRGAGPCAWEDVPAGSLPRFGRGRGGRAPGRGGGRRWRHWFYATGVPGWARFADDPPAGETAALKAQAERLREELEAIDQRLQELEK